MNLYDFHTAPATLDFFSVAGRQVPAIFWHDRFNLFTKQPSASSSAFDEDRQLQLRQALRRREPAIAHDAVVSIAYAKTILGDRFPLAEAVIASRANTAFNYALQVISGRWAEGEPAISRNAHYSVLYAVHVVKRRFPEGEAAMKRFFACGPRRRHSQYIFERYCSLYANDLVLS